MHQLPGRELTLPDMPESHRPQPPGPELRGPLSLRILCLLLRAERDPGLALDGVHRRPHCRLYLPAGAHLHHPVTPRTSENHYRTELQSALIVRPATTAWAGHSPRAHSHHSVWEEGAEQEKSEGLRRRKLSE